MKGNVEKNNANEITKHNNAQCSENTNNKRDETPNEWEHFIFVEKQKSQTVAMRFVMLQALKT